MSERKQGTSRQGAVKPAAEIAGSKDTPLDVLLQMMRDPGIGSGDRIEIAKICLPFVHPRIAQIHPPEPEAVPQNEPVDICDPRHVLELVRRLAFALSESREQRREMPDYIWHGIKYIPR